MTYQLGGEGGWAIQSQDSTSIIFAKGSRLITFELRFNNGDPRFYPYRTAGLDLPTAKHTHELLVPDNDSLWALLKERGYPLPATIEAREEAVKFMRDSRIASPWKSSGPLLERTDDQGNTIVFIYKLYDTGVYRAECAETGQAIAFGRDTEEVKKAADKYLLLQGWLLK